MSDSIITFNIGYNTYHCVILFNTTRRPYHFVLNIYKPCLCHHPTIAGVSNFARAYFDAKLNSRAKWKDSAETDDLTTIQPPTTQQENNINRNIASK